MQVMGFYDAANAGEIAIPDKLFSPETTEGYNKQEDTYFIGSGQEPGGAIHLGKGLYVLERNNEMVGFVLTNASKIYEKAEVSSEMEE